MPCLHPNTPLINRLPAVPAERPLALSWLTKRFAFTSPEVAATVAELAFAVGKPR